MNTYQVDRLDENGQPDSTYEIIVAPSAKKALEIYLVDWDMSNVITKRKEHHLVASCPDETTNTWRVMLVKYGVQ